MPPAKKASASQRRSQARTSRGGVVRWLFGPGRPLALLLLIAALFGGLWYAAWQHVRDRVLSAESYKLLCQGAEITPPPEWIHTDIRVRVFQDASLDRPLSITEDDLVERIRNAFALHPWVAKVDRVQKFHPGRVKVDLTYRRPVAMVDLAGELIPIDQEGVVLPKDDFTPVEASRYARLTGVDSRPLGPEGTRWGDARVAGGAEIAAALVEVWKDSGLAQIAAARLSPELRETPRFDLVARDGTRIHWGRAPAGDAPGDPPVPDKMKRLELYLHERGVVEGQPAKTVLDLSRPGAAQGSPGPAPLVPLP